MYLENQIQLGLLVNPEKPLIIMARGASTCLFLILLSLLTICSTGNLVGFSYDARSNSAATSCPTQIISFLKRNKLISPSQIRVFVADPGALSSLSNTGVTVDLYLNESLLENLINFNSSAATTWLKTNITAFLPHVNIKSIVVSSSSNDLHMLLSTLKSIHSVLASYRLDTKIKVSVMFSVKFVENLNTRHEKDLHRIFNFIKKVESFVSVEASVDGELSMGDRFVLSVIKKATHAASIVPRTDVPIVLIIKSPAVPSPIEVAEFTDKVSKSLEHKSRIMGQIVELYVEISLKDDFAQKELEREKEQIFPSSHRELLNNFHFKTILHDTIFPATPVTIPPDTATPTIVTVPSTSPVTTTPESPIPIPTTTPVTVPSTNPDYSPVPISDPVTTPISVPSVTNPVTTYPAPAGNVPVTDPVVPVPPATMNGPAIAGQSWCVAKAGALESGLQSALDYACGMGGADCSQIQQGGSCYNPNTIQNHASYAFNSYYQRHPAPTSCDFGGTAAIVNTNPGTGSCLYPSLSSSSSPSTSTPIPTPTTSTPTPTTSTSTSTPIPTPTTASSSTPTSSLPPSGTDFSGSGTPPTVLNTSNPASASTSVFGSASPPGVNNSASISAGLKPFVGCIILLTSFVTGKINLDI